MRRIIILFRDMKFRYKLLCTYLLVCVIPISILGGYSIQRTKARLTEQTHSSLSTSLKQAETTLDRALTDQENIASSLSFNSTVLSALNQKYESYYDMYDKCILQLAPVMQTATIYNSSLQRILFYSGANNLRIGPYIVPISEISDTEWFQTVMSDGVPHWIALNNQQLFLVQRIVNLRGESYPNLLYIESDYQQMFEPFLQICEDDYGLTILNKNGQVLFHKTPIDCADLEPEQLIHMDSTDTEEVSVNGTKYTFLSQPLTSHDMTIFFYQTADIADSYVSGMVGTVLIVVALCIIFSFLVSWVLMLLVVRRIEQLTANMKAIENGKMEVWVSSEANDEVGTMIHAFNNMITCIQGLIQEVRKTAVAKREFQLKALYTQVNPHFLYNVLSVINWKALDIGADDICEVTHLLSAFYRTALNHGNDTITVEDEIKNARAYIRIQQIMHDRAFSVEYQIEEGVSSLRILNFILQPLIENAILHGIDNMTGREGVLKIACFTCEDKLLFRITDNGCGIPEDKMTCILAQDSIGFGLKNINERIQLFYGKEYGLSIQSEIDHGTEVTITLPYIRP